MKFWIRFTLLLISARSAFAILGVLGGAGIGFNVGVGAGVDLGGSRSAHVPKVGCPNGGGCGRPDMAANYHPDYGMPRNYPGSYGAGMGADVRRNSGMSGNYGNYRGGVIPNYHDVDMRGNSGISGNYAGGNRGGTPPNNHGGDVRDSPRPQQVPADLGPQRSGGPNKYRHNYTIKHNYAIEGNETLAGGNEIDFHRDGEVETSHTTNDSNLRGRSNLAAISQNGAGAGAGVPRCPNAAECAGASGAPVSVGINVLAAQPAAAQTAATPGSLGASGLLSLQGGAKAGIAPLFKRQ